MVGASKGRRPASISYRITPTAHMSAWWSTLAPARARGKRLGVPSTRPAWVRFGSVASEPRKRAMPKSSSFTDPSGASRMLAGFTSR